MPVPTTPLRAPASIEPIGAHAPVDALHILDTLPQQVFEDLAGIACSISNAAMVMFLLHDRERHTFKAQVGIPKERWRELFELCSTPVANPGHVSVIDHPTIAFYARVPLLSPEGVTLATVCLLDDVPGELTQSQRDGLEALARQAAGMLGRRYKALQVKRLLEEREYLHGRMEGYQRDLERRNAELHQLATHDSLTGLWNRGALDALISAPDSAARLFNDYYTIAMLDVDHFKQVNDTYGHAIGDEALRQVAAVIADCVRGNDIAIRYGGEEFAVVMPATHVAGARILVERIRLRVQELKMPFPLTLSAGLAAGRSDEFEPRAVFIHADQALYQAKRLGRNRVHAYED